MEKPFWKKAKQCEAVRKDLTPDGGWLNCLKRKGHDGPHKDIWNVEWFGSDYASHIRCDYGKGIKFA